MMEVTARNVSTQEPVRAIIPPDVAHWALKALVLAARAEDLFSLNSSLISAQVAQ